MGLTPPTQPASSLLRAAARVTARMKAPRTPLLSSSVSPAGAEHGS